MIGSVGILLSFLSALIAAILFFRIAYNKKNKVEAAGKRALLFYHIHMGSLLLTSVYLLYALLAHQFQYYYVYAHSSLDLPVKYLISAFWAGQEGTFLLWALITAVAGYILIKREIELLAAVMTLVLLSQTFLMLFLILANPFFHLGQIPVDGMGLNPLLMDPWMVIHPPIIFIGYALLVYAYAYAIAALWKKDWDKGLLRAMPWAVSGWFFLGLGILIGGAWAYRVLGWGGYWGWDPVENASLVPWLTGTALVHGLIIQKEKKIFQRSNLVLAILTYPLIIFATFLTRSGVMADYSVHAFAETTLTYVIFVYLLSFLSIGAFLFLKHYKALPAGNLKSGFLSRHFSFTLSSFILTMSATLILLGTLSPILTGLFGNPAGVEEAFYLQTNAPLYFILFITLALCPLLSWKDEKIGTFLLKLRYLLVLIPLSLLVGYLLGINSFSGLLMLPIMVSALAVNLVMLFKVFKRGLKFGGGYLAHVGLTLLMIGFLGSTVYTESQIIALPKGETVEALGYNFNYLGIRVEDANNYPEILVSNQSTEYIARPNFYMAGNRVMRSPDIYRTLLNDTYISPLEVRFSENRETATLSLNQAYTYKNYLLTFKGFQFEPHGDSGIIEVGAVIEVLEQNSVQEYIPTIRQDASGRISEPLMLPGGEQLILDEINADTGWVVISLVDQGAAESRELFIVEVKIKPLISLLVAGSILLSLGMALATWRRFS